MPNLNASLGLAQLSNLNQILKAKKIHQIYGIIFKNNKYFDLFLEKKHSQSNHWLNTLLIKKDIKLRNKILFSLNKNIFCRPTWKLLHKLQCIKNVLKMI